jgi:hypothetical protein
MKKNLTLLFMLAIANCFGQFDALQYLVYEPEYHDNTVIADLNNDGNMDFFIAASGPKKPHYYTLLNGELINPIEINTGLYNLRDAIDMDMDGDMDLLYSNGWATLENGNFLSDVIFPESWGLTNCKGSYDFNSDGFPDLLFESQTNTNDDIILICFNNGSGDFSNTTYLLNNQNSPFPSPFVVDVNMDGNPDIIGRDNYVWKKWINNGDGTFQSSASFPYLSDLPEYFVCLDINNDGYEDMVYSDSNDQTIRYKYYIENGMYSGQQTVVDLTDSRPMHISQYVQFAKNFIDFDQDGDYDIIQLKYNNEFLLHRNDGSGNFESPIVLSSNVTNYRIHWANLNGDNFPDLILLDGKGVSGIATAHNNSGNAIDQYELAFPGLVNFEKYSLFDLNNDNFPDVICSTNTGIGWVANETNNEYSEVVSLYEMAGIKNFQMHDMDNDGFGDLIIQTGDGIFYAHAQSANTFDELATIYSGTFLYAVNFKIEDVNNDELDDIFIPHLSANEHMQYFRNEITQFSGPYSTGVANDANFSLYEYLINDFDNDFIRDLFYSTEEGTFISFGQADGTYAEPTLVSMVGSSTLNSGDIDNDGDLDVLGWQEVFKNNGNGQFTMIQIPGFDGEFFNIRTLVDADEDGELDIVAYSSSGWVVEMDLFNHNGYYVLYHVGNMNFTSPTFTSENLIIPNYATGIEAVDFNQDGIEDVFLHTNSSFAVIANNSDLIYHIQLQVFVDENGDGIKDENESTIANVPAYLPVQDNYMYTNMDGTIYLAGPSNNYEFEVMANESVWTYSTANEFDVLLTPENSDLLIQVGLLALGTIPSINATATFHQEVCGSIAQRSISIQNTGNTIASGQVVYTLESLSTFESATPAPSQINGNIITWDYEDLGYNEQYQIELIIQYPEAENLGATITYELEATVLDDLGNVLFTDLESDSLTISCSFDPNDKTEHNGWTENGFVLSNTPLEYTVRFQNTGTAPAVDVRIEDQLSSLVQWNTLEVKAWSHDFELMIDESGKAIFSFNDIMLPDVNSDELGSQGYIRFAIMQAEDLPVGTQIENTAEIFFDLNEPVVTNTTVNEIFDCSNLAQFTTDNSSVCPGASVVANSSTEYGTNFVWTLNDQEIDYNDYTSIDLLESGVYSLSLEVSNPLCSNSSTQELLVYDVETPILVLEEGEISTNSPGTFEWYFNGSLIENATGMSFLPDNSGSYYVQVTDNNGCTSTSNVLEFVSVIENDIKEYNIQPNPASTQTTIQLNAFYVGQDVKVFDSLGRVVFQSVINSNQIQLDLSMWEQGAYVISIMGQNKIMIVQ